MEITQSEQQTERQMKKKKESDIQDLYNIQHANLHIIGVPEGEEREKGIKNAFEEITAGNFPNLKKETDIQVQEAQRLPNKINPNRPRPKHIIIKIAKFKEQILQAAREKQRVSYKGPPPTHTHKAIS